MSKEEVYNFGVIYRSPNSTIEQNQKLNNLIEAASKSLGDSKEELLLFGDFNFRDISWDAETSNKNEEHCSTKFLNCVNRNYLFQIVNEPTHHRGLQQTTLIDLILVKNEKVINNLTYIPPFGKSHHDVLNFNITINTELNVQKQSKFLINKGDYDAMRDSLKNKDGDFILNEEEVVDTWWDKILTSVEEAKHKYVPCKTFFKNKQKRKISADPTLLNKFKLKRDLFKVFKSNPTRENYNNYCNARSIVKAEVRKAKKEKELKVAKLVKSNPKAFYQYVASQTKPKEKVSNLENENGNMTENDQEKTEVLNSFFSSVFTNENTENIPSFEKRTDELLTKIEITQDDMYRALRKLNPSKSPGPDQLHPRILKELSQELSYPLFKLFNRSLKEGKVPSAWKLAEVVPIFKKGNKTSANNYRPVSLTCIVCKIFESFVKTELFNHIIKNDLLSNNQFGFCPGRSCSTQLLVTLQDWLINLDNKTPVDCIYMDFKKAFDSVPHQRLLVKLKGYGIDGNVLNWIEDFLTDRSQYVSINGFKSSTKPVTSGVPQGSVLGPTLFIYFINDLPEVVKAIAKMFADDTKSYTSLTSYKDHCDLQSDIDNMDQWTYEWLLFFNNEKCKCMHLGKNNPHYNYTIGCGEQKRNLDITNLEKDLGVYIDPLLKFDSHIAHVVKNVNR